MRKTVKTIGGIDFKVKYPNKPEKWLSSIPERSEYEYTSIYDAYVQPSSTKVEIWQEWLEWADDCGAVIWISSRNSHFFTIRGRVRDTVGSCYEVYITSTRHELTPVDEVE